MHTSSHSIFLKWVVIVLLGMMLVGGVALVYWLPVRSYGITCEKVQQISCAVERETASGLDAWHISLGTDATATVRIEPRRRGASRVFLYLNSGSQANFAAEFEGGTAVADAEVAAAQLNQIFLSTSPASTRVQARPPAHLRWLAWGGLGLLALLILTVYRELLKQDSRPDIAIDADISTASHIRR